MCILLGLIDSNLYLQEEGKYELFNCGSSCIICHMLKAAISEESCESVCQSSLVIWQVAEAAEPVSTLEVTPRTSRSSQMRPRGDNGSKA